MYDAVIIGAGTAGMTAGIYLARQGKRAIILEGNTYGGQIVNSLGVENYPGIKNISGFVSLPLFMSRYWSWAER